MKTNRKRKHITTKNSHKCNAKSNQKMTKDIFETFCNNIRVQNYSRLLITRDAVPGLILKDEVMKIIEESNYQCISCLKDEGYTAVQINAEIQKQLQVLGSEELVKQCFKYIEITVKVLKSRVLDKYKIVVTTLN